MYVCMYVFMYLKIYKSFEHLSVYPISILFCCPYLSDNTLKEDDVRVLELSHDARLGQEVGPRFVTE